jgi:hypothetical protein
MLFVVGCLAQVIRIRVYVMVYLNLILYGC